MPSRQETKTQYSETEAADALGLSLDQLRSLIQRVVERKDGDPANFPVAQLQAADMLLLRMLATATCTLPD